MLIFIFNLDINLYNLCIYKKRHVFLLSNDDLYSIYALQINSGFV